MSELASSTARRATASTRWRQYPASVRGDSGLVTPAFAIAIALTAPEVVACKSSHSETAAPAAGAPPTSSPAARPASPPFDAGATLPQRATDLACGSNSCCAVLADATVLCWGGPDRRRPTVVPELGDVASVSVGNDHACARGRDGNLRCWGNNHYGQLGDGTTATRAAPGLVPGLTAVVSVAAARDFTCAVTDGSVFCWGRNVLGQLGDGSRTDGLEPRRVLSGATWVGAGFMHACALMRDATVQCWGYSHHGQTGRPPSDVYEADLLPHRVDGLGKVASLSVGWLSTTAVTRSGAVLTLGNASTCRMPDRRTPVALQGLHDIAAVSGSCALTQTGVVRCWGIYASIAAGRGPKDCAPGDFVSLPAIAQIAASNGFACARTQSDEIWCWGGNTDGQMGDGPTGNMWTPVRVPVRVSW